MCLSRPLTRFIARIGVGVGERGEERANWQGARVGGGCPAQARCTAETIGRRSAPVISGARNRSSAGDKKPAENEIRITVVGPGPDNGRIMMTPAPIALRYHRPPRPADHIFPAFFPVSLPPPARRLPQSCFFIEISIQSCADRRSCNSLRFSRAYARECIGLVGRLKEKEGRNRRISAEIVSRLSISTAESLDYFLYIIYVTLYKSCPRRVRLFSASLLRAKGLQLRR